MVTALTLDARLAVPHLIAGEYVEAERAAARCTDLGGRLRLAQIRLTGLGLRACVAAHQNRRRELETLVSRFRDGGGEQGDFAVALWGLGLAVSALLGEDPGRARAGPDHAARLAVARPSRYWALARGPHLLLAGLAGEAGRADLDEADGMPRGSGWNQRGSTWYRRFVLLARAAMYGRDGQAGA